MNYFKLLILLFTFSILSCSSDDDNRNTENEKCELPLNATITDLSPTSITVEWEASANQSSVIIEYGISGFTQGTGISINVEQSPYELTGLETNTSYDFYFKTICSENLESEFSEVFTYTINVCEPPTNINVSNITSASASISWESSNNFSTTILEYGLSGFAIGSGSIITSIESPFTLEGLAENTTYDFYLKSICNDTIESDISLITSFTTDSCTPVTYDGNLHLTSQEAIDQLSTACYTHINGELTIDGTNSNITNLQGLASITSIQNKLSIKNTPNLNDLTGLDNLTSIIDWDLHIENTGITSLQGLHNLSNLGYALTLINNPNLTSLGSLQTLFQNQNDLYEIYIKDNAALTSLDIQHITDLQGLYIYNNDALTSLNSLENLINVYLYAIRDNDALADFCALQNLFSNGSFNTDESEISNNLFNPTIQNIIDGNCSQ